MGSILAVCRDEHPGAEVDLMQGHPRRLEQELRAGTVAVALLRHPIAPDLHSGAVLRRPLGALVREDSPLAAGDVVEVFDLAGHELVLFPRDQAPEHYDELVADLRALGFAPASIRAADGLAVGRGSSTRAAPSRSPTVRRRTRRAWRGARWRARRCGCACRWRGRPARTVARSTTRSRG